MKSLSVFLAAGILLQRLKQSLLLVLMKPPSSTGYSKQHRRPNGSHRHSTGRQVGVLGVLQKQEVNQR